MRIDGTHRKWANATGLLLVVATLSYVPYAWLARNGPSGSSWPGLAYGIAGFGMMIFAALLSLRKRFPVWRIGRAQTWMRGHLWLGFLCYPIIWFHAGFSLGGSLTTTLMVLFTFVFISGLAGAVLQHYLPNVITRQVGFETIYEQIDSVVAKLRDEAEKIMEPISPTLETFFVAAAGRADAISIVRKFNAKELEPLRVFYKERLKPYLAASGGRHELASQMLAEGIFSQVRKMSPKDVGEIIDDLENICEEKRQLERQRYLHRLLHGWLFVHVPISWALLILGAVHAVVALRY